MRQPELGKKIADLRKEKGFTQEELVEKCNLNVRTIQRIEAGEVTPRSYTVKTILGALDYDFEKIQSEFTNINESNIDYSPGARKIFSWAFYMGIVFFLLGFVELCLDLDAGLVRTFDVSATIYVTVKLACLVSMLFFYRGFIAAGQLFHNYLLKVSSIFMLVIFAISYVLDILFWFVTSDIEEYALIVSIILISCGTVLNGIGIMRLKNYFGTNLTSITGILTIFSGATLFALIGLILMIPVTILQLILMYRIREFRANI